MRPRTPIPRRPAPTTPTDVTTLALWCDVLMRFASPLTPVCLRIGGHDVPCTDALLEMRSGTLTMVLVVQE